MIHFACPHCDARLKADDAYAGRQIACKACGERISIPHALPPTRRGGLADAPEPAAPTAEDFPAEEMTMPPPVRRPGGADAVLTTNGDHPPQPIPFESSEDEQGYAAAEPSTYPSESPAAPPRRSFGVLSTLLGLPGSLLFAAGAFLPLFEVNGKSLLNNDWRLWLVQSGGVLLGLVALGLVLTRRYAGLWVLGPGSLIALLLAYGLLFARATEEHGIEKAMLLRPGTGLLILLGGAVLLTLAVFLSPRRKRYEYNG